MSLQPPTPPDIIKALSPLLANTTIRSPKDSVNWNKELAAAGSPSKFLEKYLTHLGNRIQWLLCPKCKAEVNALAPLGICITCADQIAAIEKRDLENGQLLVKSIGRHGVEKFGFDQFRETEGNKMALILAHQFDPTKNNLYLWGPCGTGKTHLAGAIFKAAAGAGCWIKWTDPIYIARGVRVRFAHEEAAFIEDISAVDVLVIDDLGIGRDVGVILQAVYEIMNIRRKAKKNGLIITSNHSMDELSKKFGDDRFSSRVTELCDVVEVRGKDARLVRADLLA